MRGCGVVLYVAVLLCFLNSAFGALDCGVNGAKTFADVCVCKSGFSGATCGTAPTGCTVLESIADTANHFPKLVSGNATVFQHNTLYAKITGPIVANRTYTELVFTNSNDGASSVNRCSFGTPSSFWTITTSCDGDVFSLALPWVDHTKCGFDKNTAATNAAVLVVSAKLHLKYVDYVYVPLGVDEATGESTSYMLDRTVSIPYQMHVTFQKTIEVKLLALNITSDVKFGAALTGDEYDPELGILTLTMTTIINYPNSFKRSDNVFTTPANVSLINTFGLEASNLALFPPGGYMGAGNVYALGVYTDTCPTSSATEEPCTQYWQVKLKLKDGCTFDGDYFLQMHLYTCRGTNDGNDQDCTEIRPFVNFTMSTQSVCGNVGVTPIVTGELVPWIHKAGIDVAQYDLYKKSQFKLGEYGNFFAKIASDGNDIYLNFTDVRFKVKTDPDVEASWVYLYKNKAHVASAQYCQLDLQHAKKFFTIYFHSSVFKVNPEQMITYTFSATVDILFEGNQGEQKKRTVEYTYESSSMNTEATASLSNSAKIATVQKPGNVVAEKSDNSVTFIASVVGAVAGTMIIVFVVVGFALRTRAQSERRDAAASAAVVAANAAAQAIDVAVTRA